MVLWEIFAIVGLTSLILEMLLPSMFFLNLALAGFLTAIVALFLNNWIHLTVIFVILSIISILFLRPILLKHKENKEQETNHNLNKRSHLMNFRHTAKAVADNSSRSHQKKKNKHVK